MARAVLAGILHVNDLEEESPNAKVRAMESHVQIRLKTIQYSYFFYFASLRQRVLSTDCDQVVGPAGPIYIFTLSTMLIEPSQPGSNTFRNLSNEFEYLLIASSWTASMLDSFRHTLRVRHLRKDCVKPTRDTRKRSQVVRTPVRSSVYLLHVSIWGTFRNALNALQLKSFTMSSNRLHWVWLVGKFTII